MTCAPLIHCRLTNLPVPVRDHKILYEQMEKTTGNVEIGQYTASRVSTYLEPVSHDQVCHFRRTCRVELRLVHANVSPYAPGAIADPFTPVAYSFIFRSRALPDAAFCLDDPVDLARPY